MTKAEEREVLQKICDLIKSTGTDSYISMAFRGVPEYAERNIAEDAAYNPIDELGSEYAKNLRKDSEYGQKLLKLEHERDVALDQLKQSREAYEEKHQMWSKATDAVAELTKQVESMQDGIADYEERIEKQKAEIMRLKAEIYDWERA